MYELAQVAQPIARPAATAGSIASVLTAIGRMEEAIEAETAAIRNDPGFDIKASNARKSRYLYELNRAARGVEFKGAPHMVHRHADGTEEWLAFFKDPEGRFLALLSQVRPSKG